MAQKTALQIVNVVLQALRQPAVETFDDDYTQLILQYVNQSKEDMEDAWEWGALQYELEFDSTPNTYTIDIGQGSGIGPVETNERSFVVRDVNGMLQMWDVGESSPRWRMTEVTRDQARNRRRVTLPNVQPLERPSQVAIYQVGNGLEILYAHRPLGVRSYIMSAFVPQEPFTAIDETLILPSRPVELRATALAIAERGEEIGISSATYEAQYQDYLAQSIARDIQEADMTMVPV